ncbi:unnamed protein product [Durusdinium trenchii]|uniref:Serine aminopeptidase S33 domain-containing protein n=2 Tax=Durusdinium trenchii TaxID=1381693 RepID=A0ABP0Q0L8_9DINO
MESTRPSVVFLHGFGGPSKVEQAFLERLRENFEAVGVTLRAPTYHPGGHVAATSLPSFLEELAAELEQHTQHAHAQSVLVGFSVGGYLVANFQERWPHLVKKAVLLAPAIDNFDRNFKDKLPEKWHMPVAYVKELQGMSARPAIKVPTMLVHGELETDQGGSALWRMKEWEAAEDFTVCHYPKGLGHSLEIVEEGPGFNGLVSWILAE